jgi:DNA-binding MarR family transcriptional regulator
MTHYDPATYVVHNSIGYLMRRGAGLLREQIEASFTSAGITFIQWATLILVRDHPGTTAAEVCRDLRHDSGAFTRVLDQLEARGLLQRLPSASDRRCVELRVTDEGLAVVRDAIPLVTGCLNRALGDFSAREVAQLTDLLLRMIVRLEASP